MEGVGIMIESIVIGIAVFILFVLFMAGFIGLMWLIGMASMTPEEMHRHMTRKK